MAPHILVRECDERDNWRDVHYDVHYDGDAGSPYGNEASVACKVSPLS